MPSLRYLIAVCVAIGIVNCATTAQERSQAEVRRQARSRIDIAAPGNEQDVAYVLPDFRTDSPLYCFVNLPCDTNVSRTTLLVLDGDVLYFDRDFDRDLTEPESKIDAEENQGLPANSLRFRIPTIKAGNREHREFTLTVSPLRSRNDNSASAVAVLDKNSEALSFEMYLEVHLDRFQSIGINGNVPTYISHRDQNGVLQFGVTPQQAPRINFCGDLEVRMSDKNKFHVGSSTEVSLVLGFPGHGPGSFAAISYQGVVPPSVFPEVILEFTGEATGGVGQSTTHTIRHRC